MISEAKVKELLGLTDYIYDNDITLLLPLVKADVRRIMNHNYKERTLTTITAGATTFLATYNNFDHPFIYGRVLEGTGVAPDTYVLDYDEQFYRVTVNNAFTASTDRIYNSISISQWMAIARMVWWRIQKVRGNVADIQVASKSMGPVSITYDTGKMNKTYGYPQVIIDDLGTPYQRF